METRTLSFRNLMVHEYLGNCVNVAGCSVLRPGMSYLRAALLSKVAMKPSVDIANPRILLFDDVCFGSNPGAKKG
jgi:hypothetical protein